MRRRGALAAMAMGMACVGCATAGTPAGARPRTPPSPRIEPPPIESTGGEALVGGCGEAPLDLRPRYILPFAEGDGYVLTQGNCGRASHDGRFSYSFDFRMPIGTPIIAARDGVVYASRDDRPDGSGRVGDENFVILEHDAGEFSRYIHLTTDGALVARGERVARGDTIALSGHSGRSAFPHLHFDVAHGCRGGPCRTVPSAFLNADPPIPDLRIAIEAAEAPDPPDRDM